MRVAEGRVRPGGKAVNASGDAAFGGRPPLNGLDAPAPTM